MQEYKNQMLFSSGFLYLVQSTNFNLIFMKLGKNLFQSLCLANNILIHSLSQNYYFVFVHSISSYHSYYYFKPSITVCHHFILFQFNTINYYFMQCFSHQKKKVFILLQWIMIVWDFSISKHYLLRFRW